MISFVILNYNSFDLTKECIKKIRSNKTNYEVKIVVVDNNTLNGKEKDELEKLADKVIINKENIGFAKGNNIGINYAKQNYNPTLVCALNSDCFIEDSFIDKVFKIYEQEKFDMFGPKIYSLDGKSWNPFPVFKTYEEVTKRIKYYEKLDKFYNSRVLNLILSVYLKLKSNKDNKDKNGLEKQYGIALHGCCIVFSLKYLNKYEDAFYNDTFLYHEEEFLYYRIIKDKLKTLYDPSVLVNHLEGGATKNTYSNNRKKNLFRNKYRLDSLRKLKKLMEQK